LPQESHHGRRRNRCSIENRGRKIGRLAGEASAADLGAHVIKALLQKTGLKPDRISEVIMGPVLRLLSTQFDPLKAVQPAVQPPTRTLSEQVEQFERALVEDMLRRHKGNAAAASEVLGMPRKTFYDKLHRLGLAAEDFR
jgi:DNA-binding NtrC family response regulator